ncbi:MAG TPA: hypothetical protein VLV88_09350 [Terriglobales bacterium]|nr:hypothetical protein [Terriglobales bacterium]
MSVPCRVVADLGGHDSRRIEPEPLHNGSYRALPLGVYRFNEENHRGWSLAFALRFAFEHKDAARHAEAIGETSANPEDLEVYAAFC